MSDAAPKQSRFWGATPRRIKWLFYGYFVLLTLASIGLIYFLLRDYLWKMDVRHFAGMAGSYDASWYYARGSHRLLVITPIDDSAEGTVPDLWEMKPTGRQSDGCEIYSYYVSSYAGVPRAGEEAYVGAFNHWMRTVCANPQWFDSQGRRLGPNEGDTNRPPLKVIPEE